MQHRLNVLHIEYVVSFSTYFKLFELNWQKTFDFFLLVAMRTELQTTVGTFNHVFYFKITFIGLNEHTKIKIIKPLVEEMIPESSVISKLMVSNNVLYIYPYIIQFRVSHTLLLISDMEYCEPNSSDKIIINISDDASISPITKSNGVFIVALIFWFCFNIRAAQDYAQN